MPEKRTTIRVPISLKNQLDKLKISDWEPYQAVIARLIETYEQAERSQKKE